MLKNQLQKGGKLFRDRYQAGQELSKLLAKYAGEKPVVLALPRGGVPVGYHVAQSLNAPLDVIIVKKIGLPQNKEFGVGAVAEDDTQILDQRTLSLIGVPKEYLKEALEEEREEMKRRQKVYRQNKSLSSLKNKTVILVDDGLATGVTAKAAIEAVKKQKPKKIIFASPVCAYDTAMQLRQLVDEVVCVATPQEFIAVGNWYDYFPQLSDQEVVEILQGFRQRGDERSDEPS